MAERFTEGFAKSLADEGVSDAKIYLSQNDGTLMTMEHARRYPILTIACGPTNSIRGASYLSGIEDAIVIDVGGTTTDLGVIKSGFPRESSLAAVIGGVRTNFRMPDVVSIGLGGGSIVREHPDGSVTVGPDSVGYEITKKALVFGGDVVTATDIAVRLGMADIGDASLAAGLDKGFARKAMEAIRELVEDAIDAMKVSSDPVDVILVGGGSVILPEDLAGAKSVRKPEHFGIANAIGSAISKVSGTYEKLVNYDEVPREKALEQAKAEAAKLAVEAGGFVWNGGNHRCGGCPSAVLSGQYEPGQDQGCGRVEDLTAQTKGSIDFFRTGLPPRQSCSAGEKQLSVHAGLTAACCAYRTKNSFPIWKAVL